MKAIFGGSQTKPSKNVSAGGHNSKRGIFFKKGIDEEAGTINSDQSKPKTWWPSFENDEVGPKMMNPTKIEGKLAAAPDSKSCTPKKKTKFSFQSKKGGGEDTRIIKNDPSPSKPWWARWETDNVDSKTTEEAAPGSKKKQPAWKKARDVEDGDGGVTKGKKTFFRPFKIGSSEAPETTKEEMAPSKTWWPWSGDATAGSAATDAPVDENGAKKRTSVACIAGAFFWGALLIAGIVTGAIYLSKSEPLPLEPSTAPSTSLMPSNAPSTLDPSAAPSQLPSYSPPPTRAPVPRPSEAPSSQPSLRPDPPKGIVANGSFFGLGTSNWSGSSESRVIGLQEFRLAFGGHRSIKKVKAKARSGGVDTAFYGNNFNNAYDANVAGVLLPMATTKEVTLSGVKGCHEKYLGSETHVGREGVPILTGFSFNFLSGETFFRKMSVLFLHGKLQVCFYDGNRSSGSIRADIDYALISPGRVKAQGQMAGAATAQDLEFELGNVKPDLLSYTTPVMRGFSLEFTDPPNAWGNGDDNEIKTLSAGVFFKDGKVYGKGTLTDGHNNRGIKAEFQYALIRA